MPKASKGKDELEIRRRDQLYRLIISQLFYDGFKEPAFKLCEIFKPHPTCPPSDRLLQITQLSLQLEEERNEQTNKTAIAPISGIDLEFETEVQSISAEAALYETCYVTAHKAACRAATFHHSGQLIATGSEDASIKILDVERMLAKSATPPELIAMETPQQQMENHPVIRTLYDHNDEISCLDFHPTEQILASGSKDYTVKLFEYSKPSVKKAYKSIQEVQPIRCLSFHPSGDFLLVGVNHPTLRLYDVNTFQSYVANDPIYQHSAPVTDVKWSPNGKMFVTCGKDGDIKLYDGVSLKCFNTFKNAHDSKEVTSVVFSKNSKYILSSGKDSLVKLWELSTNRCLIVYTGAGATGRMDHRTRATFNHTEDYVLFPDEKTTSLCCWDSRNAERQRLLGLGHNGVVRSIVHSPTGPAFMSCSDDCRARFWYRKATAD